MNLRKFAQLFSFRDVRNGLLGLAVVLGGLGLAFLTIYAQRTDNPKLAAAAAVASLIFVLLIFVFVIPPLARSASRETSQMNLPFDFTLGGAVIVALIAIVGFSAWSSGNNLLFLILAFLISAVIVSFFGGNLCLKKLDVKMRFPETVFAKEPTPILVSLHNRKRILPAFSIVAEVRGKEREKSALFEEIKEILPEKWARKIVNPPIIKRTLEYFVYIPKRDSVESRTEHIFEKRGRFIIKDFELSTKFPFGFFRHRRRLSAQRAEIIIFPKISEILQDEIKLPLETGTFRTNRKGLGQDLLTLREYQPMDDLRHIDWKATARTNRLITREFAAEDDKRITIFFDTRLRSDLKKMSLREKISAEQKGENFLENSGRFEKGVSKTAAMLSNFTDEQAEIRLITPDEFGEFGNGKNHLYKSLKRLALIEQKTGEKSEISDEILDEMLTERKNSFIFFVTAENEMNLPAEILQTAKVINF